MTWGKYSHLSTYHFLQALEAEGVHPDAIIYIRGLVSRIEEYENQQDEFDSELGRLDGEIELMNSKT